jgi:hypothetical protein
MEECYHCLLVSCSSIFQIEQHDLIPKGTSRSDECGFLLILFSHFDLTISKEDISKGIGGYLYKARESHPLR